MQVLFCSDCEPTGHAWHLGRRFHRRSVDWACQERLLSGRKPHCAFRFHLQMQQLIQCSWRHRLQLPVADRPNCVSWSTTCWKHELEFSLINWWFQTLAVYSSKSGCRFTLLQLSPPGLRRSWPSWSSWVWTSRVLSSCCLLLCSPLSYLSSSRPDAPTPPPTPCLTVACQWLHPATMSPPSAALLIALAWQHPVCSRSAHCPCTPSVYYLWSCS